MNQHHGRGTRGLDSTPSSSLFEGRFGRMFRTLPAAEFGNNQAETEAALRKLAMAMVAEDEFTDPSTIATKPDELDEEENTAIPAGYTYLGQFIDHDLTFDPMSSLQKTNDPDALTNFRTPRFDLDCIYGRGPDDQPYMYAQSGGTQVAGSFLLGRPLTGADTNPNAQDLPRAANQREIIGDKRNDENVIVSQLHGLFLRFHNRLMAKGNTFDQAQRLTRWHYQYMILHDFLPRIVGQDMVNQVLPHLKSGKTIFEDKPVLNFYGWECDPYIPVEFSVAAYRLGHSMVRPDYRISDTISLVIFDDQNPNKGFNGFREFPASWAIDWGKFFELDPRPPKGIKRILPSYRLDTSLVNPLSKLPDEVGDLKILPLRNLLRARSMDLPSGQTVAKAMSLTPLDDKDIKIGKAINDEWDDAPSIDTIDPAFVKNCPLWTYILAEAGHNQVKHGKNILGPVGGRIVCEVFVGLLLGDQHSFLSQAPNWTPIDKKFKVPDFVKFALMPLPVQAVVHMPVVRETTGVPVG